MSTMKTVLWIGMAYIASLSGCNQSTAKKQIPENATEIQKLRIRIENAIGQTDRDENRVWLKQDREKIEVFFNAKASTSREVLRANACNEFVQITHCAAEAKMSAPTVVVCALWPVKDKYGNWKNSPVLAATFDKATLKKVNWKGISTNKLLALRSSGPGLVPYKDE